MLKVKQNRQNGVPNLLYIKHIIRQVVRSTWASVDKSGGNNAFWNLIWKTQAGIVATAGVTFPRGL